MLPAAKLLRDPNLLPETAGVYLRISGSKPACWLQLNKFITQTICPQN